MMIIMIVSLIMRLIMITMIMEMVIMILTLLNDDSKHEFLSPHNLPLTESAGRGERSPYDCLIFLPSLSSQLPPFFVTVHADT